MRILGAFNRKPNALICQYNRAFSLGKLKIELLPSGGVLGGASLFVEMDGNTLLYAPLLRTKGFISLRSMQLRQAQVLLIKASHPVHMSTKGRRKNEVERLLQQVEIDIQKGRWPVLICPPVGTAQEVSFLLSERGIPVSVHPSIGKVHKVYEAFGSHVGAFHVKRQAGDDASVLLLPQSPYLRNARSLCLQRPTYLVQKDFVDYSNRYPDVEDRFYLNIHADIEDIKTLILPEVRPKRVVLFGPYSKAYADELKGFVQNVSTIFQNNQPPLF